MKYWNILWVYTIIFFIGGNSYDKGLIMNDYNECKIENSAFQGGEKLVFKAYYNWGFIWIPAGEATFLIQEHEDFLDISVEGKSYKAYDGFFKLRDKFYTRLDKYTMLPIYFERRVHEGDHKKYERIEFDQINHTAISYSGKTQNEVERNEHSFDTCMHDILSLMYFLRNIDAKSHQVGSKISSSIFFDQELFPLDVRYMGEEKKKIKGQGYFNTLKITPDVISGHVFKDGDQMNIWVSDDQNKIPLLVETPLRVGSLKAVIMSYSGIRNPLTSFVN